MKKVFVKVIGGCILTFSFCASVSHAGATTAVSISSGGALGNSYSNEPVISADGRYVAFHSGASNLVPNDANGKADIFVHDRQTGETMIISKDSAGKSGDNDSSAPAISADGRYVAFQSLAGNLTPGDTNGRTDIFVHDRQTGKTTIISTGIAANPGDNDSSAPAISADGRYVAFQSLAGNLAPGSSNGTTHVFLHNTQTGKTAILSRNTAGRPGNNYSGAPAISADGTKVAFESDADNLVPRDTNGASDIFVHDVKTGAIQIISKSRTGKPANGPSSLPAISSDGRYVAFESSASNLVPDDVNGKADAFVHDRKTGRTTVISVDSKGIQGNNGGCFIPSISGGGKHVAFESESSNLVPADSNGKADIFVRSIQ